MRPCCTGRCLGGPCRNRTNDLRTLELRCVIESRKPKMVSYSVTDDPCCRLQSLLLLLFDGVPFFDGELDRLSPHDTRPGKSVDRARSAELPLSRTGHNLRLPISSAPDRSTRVSQASNPELFCWWSHLLGLPRKNSTSVRLMRLRCSIRSARASLTVNGSYLAASPI